MMSFFWAVLPWCAARRRRGCVVVVHADQDEGVRALSASRSPPRLRRWRCVRPEDAGLGATPVRCANARARRARRRPAPAPRTLLIQWKRKHGGDVLRSWITDLTPDTPLAILVRHATSRSHRDRLP